MSEEEKKEALYRLEFLEKHDNYAMFPFGQKEPGDYINEINKAFEPFRNIINQFPRAIDLSYVKETGYILVIDVGGLIPGVGAIEDKYRLSSSGISRILKKQSKKSLKKLKK